MKNKILIFIAILNLLATVFFSISIELKIINIFLTTIILWLFVDIKWVNLLSLLSLSVIPDIGINYVVKNSLGNNIILFLMMSFILTYAFFKTPYIEKITFFLINSKFSKQKPENFILMLLTSVFIIGWFVSPTVLFILYLSIIEKIFNHLNIEKNDNVYKATIMGLVFVCAISSGMTPIAHVFPVIAIGMLERYLNININYFNYMILGFFVGVLSFIFMCWILKIFYLKDFKKISKINYDGLSNNTSTTLKDKIILFILIFTILFWIGPDFLSFFVKNNQIINYLKKLSISFPPLLAVLLLTSIEINHKKLLDFDDAFKNGIHWNAILICATTLLFGTLLTDSNFKVSNAISLFFQNNLINANEFIIVGILIFWCLIQTNFSSNIVASTLVSSLAIGIYQLGIVNFNLKAIICLIGMLSAYAFATPSAMPSVAIVVAKNYVKSKEIFIFGIILALFAGFISLFMAYPLAKVLFV